MYEGRWLHNHTFLTDYANYWFKDEEATPRFYSFWTADAIYAMCKVWGNFDLAKDLSVLICLICVILPLYHGKSISIIWDREGTQYGIGKGLHIYCDGVEKCACEKLDKIEISL